MAPDLNSLPPSSPVSLSRAVSSSNNNMADLPLRGESPAGSPRSASMSLQAAATMNAGLQQESSRRSSSSSLRNRHSPHAGRRRSTVLMNLQLNDPALPAPGEMVGDTHISQGSAYGTSSPQPLSGSPLLGARDPHHVRTPSLGELHQELEAEQEAQVNRLLHMIRTQQLELQRLQASHSQTHSGPLAEESSAVYERQTPSGSQVGSVPHSAYPNPFARSPSGPHHPRSSFDLARADLQRRSRTPSRGASPRLRATSMSGDSGDHLVLGGRDESAFYQAETQMLTRENQMLKHRIRDLERQLADATAGPSIPNEPSSHSHLLQSQSVSEGVPTSSSRHTPLPPEASGAAKE